jgi:hypothetical protein
MAESAESAPEFVVAESAESTSARLGRRGGVTVVKDRAALCARRLIRMEDWF